MKVLMTGPDNNPETAVGGILTIVNTILSNSTGSIHYFNRDLGESNKLPTYWKKFNNFKSMIARNNYSLVHFHLSFDKKSIFRDLLYIYSAKRRKQPYIIHFHGGGYIFNRKYYRLSRWILDGAESIIVLNSAERESLTNLYKVPADRIQILRNCIDLKEIEGLGANKQFENRIIYFGRLDRNKGLKEISEALGSLKQANTPFRFEIYGAGPDEEWFLSELKQTIGQSFQFKGRVWGKAKWEALSQSDVFLLPSYSEGMPMALLEAMALGKIVIVSDDVSMAKVVKHEINGLLVEKRSSTSLHQAIAAVLKDPISYNTLSQNASKLIREEYSADQYMQSLKQVYHYALQAG